MCRNHRADVDGREPKLPRRVLYGRHSSGSSQRQSDDLNMVNIMNIAERMG
jgi:hypothetical protein